MTQELERELIRSILALGDTVDKLTRAVELVNANVAINNELLRTQEDEEDGYDREAAGKHSTSHE